MSQAGRMVVCFGGTFDPVHLGHLAVARAARDALAAQVRLVPAADPPHKGPTHADALQRAHMLDLAVEGEQGLVVDRRELGRDGPSYTADTLRELRAELGPSVPVAWLVGSDSLAGLDTWHAWRELFGLAHIVAVERPGAALDMAWLAANAPAVHAQVLPRLCPLALLQARPAGGVALLPLPEPRSESSTELRRRIREGEPWLDWVAPAVARYIVAERLYRARPSHAAPL